MPLKVILGLLIVGMLQLSTRVAQAQDAAAPQIVSTASLEGRTVGLRFNDALEPNATTDRAQGVVQGLIPEDIGQPAQAGSAVSCAPGTIAVKAGGVDIWGNKDSFQFTHQERRGDFDVRVRVASFQPEGAHMHAKAVLMMRETLEPGSRHVSVAVYPTLGNWTARRRSLTDGPSETLSGDWRVNWPAATAFPDVWLRLKRAGNTITTYGSVNGEEWTQIGNVYTPKVPFPETVHVGLGTTSQGEQVPPYPMVEVRYEQFGDFVITNAQLSFLQHPTNTLIFENRPAVFTAAAHVMGTPASNLSYQWLKNDVAIPGATRASYKTPLVTLADNGARYRLRVSLPGGYTVLSKEAALAVQVDLTAPGVSSCAALMGGPIALRFDEVLGVESASDVSHYSLDGGGWITGAKVMADHCTVVLNVANLQASAHRLTVAGVTDFAGCPANTTVPFTRLDWRAEDIGAVAEPGSSYACTAGEINVRAGGGNIWTNADAFHFVQHARKGDFDVAVQMSRLSKADDYTRGGLMVREDLTPQSRNFFACTYPASGIKRWASTVRFGTGGATTLAPGNSYVLRPSSFAYPNVWFRLKRVANTFTAYYGTNGVNWTQLGEQLTPVPAYPATVYLGLATTPNRSTPGHAALAQYQNFSDWVERATDRRVEQSNSFALTNNPCIAASQVLATPAAASNHVP